MPSPHKKPMGFLHVDADGLWTLRQAYGLPEEDTFDTDPCWDQGIPKLAKLFQNEGIPASFFIVGRDMENDAKRRMLRKLVHRGFEIANHSYSHTIGLTGKPSGFILNEIKETDRALRSLGADPIGFRSPGYDVDGRILRIANRCGYLYDSSLLPTYLSPVLRIVSDWTARKWQPTKRQFGRFAFGRAPRQPYFPKSHKI